MKSVTELECQGKRVFYRPDYNVPLKDGQIQDDFRIVSTFPTLDILIEKGAKIIIGSHVGRPDGHETPGLSMMPIVERIADQYPKQVVQIAHQVVAPEVTKAIEAMKPGDILVLENLRFHKEEEENNLAFTHQLADMADFYVNDAFACDHRAHASIAGIPTILPAYAGLLVEQEIAQLGGLLKDPAKPFVVVMGGAKVSDKIEVIRSLAKIADTILIGGAMANTFLLAKGEKIGDSKAEPDKVHLAETLMEEFGDKLVIAEDFVKDSVDGEHFRYLDIGPGAIEQFKKYLGEAKTIFWNGSLGYTEDPKYAVASQAIAEYIASLKGSAASVVAGGDTVEMISRLDLHDQFSFISTGGGAALELLAGETLPGIAALEKE